MKKVLLLLSLFCLSFCPAAFAQIANSTSLVGTVVDSAGAVVKGARVTAIDESTKVMSAATTNGEGYYSIQFIQPGTYDVKVEQPGFKTTETTGVVVAIDIAVRTDVTLPVGSAGEVVTVTASTPPLSTDDARLGETFRPSRWKICRCRGTTHWKSRHWRRTSSSARRRAIAATLQDSTSSARASARRRTRSRSTGCPS